MIKSSSYPKLNKIPELLKQYYDYQVLFEKKEQKHYDYFIIYGRIRDEYKDILFNNINKHRLNFELYIVNKRYKNGGLMKYFGINMTKYHDKFLNNKKKAFLNIINERYSFVNSNIILNPFKMIYLKNKINKNFKQYTLYENNTKTFIIRDNINNEKTVMNPIGFILYNKLTTSSQLEIQNELNQLNHSFHYFAYSIIALDKKTHTKTLYTSILKPTKEDCLNNLLNR